MSTRKPTGYIIWRGPSQINGAPITVVAILRSGNGKTGAMLQTYILPDGVDPITATRTGADVAVCGDCRHRPTNDGTCYVTLAHGPRAVADGLRRGIYPASITRPGIRAIGRGRKVRLGTWGDPMAVPAWVWRELCAESIGHTGYTHQWRNRAISVVQRTAVLDLCMASVDNADEALIARDRGLRYFRVRAADEPMGAREFICPASAEGGKRRQCETCLACDGTDRDRPGKVSPVIIVHGSRASRFIPIASAA